MCHIWPRWTKATRPDRPYRPYRGCPEQRRLAEHQIAPAEDIELTVCWPGMLPRSVAQVYLVGGAVIAPVPPDGMTNTCPILSTSGLLIPLARIKAEEEIPYRLAMAERYSPAWTTCVWTVSWAKEIFRRAENTHNRITIKNMRMRGDIAGLVGLLNRSCIFITMPLFS